MAVVTLCVLVCDRCGLRSDAIHEGKGAWSVGEADHKLSLRPGADLCPACVKSFHHWRSASTTVAPELRRRALNFTSHPIVIAALNHKPEGQTVREMVQWLDRTGRRMPAQTVRNTLVEMLRRGEVEKVDRAWRRKREE